MTMENVDRKKRGLGFKYAYKACTWFLFLYGVTGLLVYLFFLIFPYTTSLRFPHLGYGPLGFTALELLKIFFLLLYGGIIYSGILLLKRVKKGLVFYFGLFLFYYVITYMYTGTVEPYLFVIQLVYGVILWWLFFKIN